MINLKRRNLVKPKNKKKRKVKNDQMKYVQINLQIYILSRFILKRY